MYKIELRIAHWVPLLYLTKHWKDVEWFIVESIDAANLLIDKYNSFIAYHSREEKISWKAELDEVILHLNNLFTNEEGTR